MPHEDDIFKVLADGHRRRIMKALCAGPMIAGELGRLVGLAPNAVSFHLKGLRSAGLVWVRREGRCLRYHANVEALAEWQAHMQGLFATAKVSTPGAAQARPRRGGPARQRRPEEPREELPEEAPEPVADTISADDFNDKLPTELL